MHERRSARKTIQRGLPRRVRSTRLHRLGLVRLDGQMGRRRTRHATRRPAGCLRQLAPTNRRHDESVRSEHVPDRDDRKRVKRLLDSTPDAERPRNPSYTTHAVITATCLHTGGCDVCRSMTPRQKNSNRVWLPRLSMQTNSASFSTIPPTKIRRSFLSSTSQKCRSSVALEAQQITLGSELSQFPHRRWKLSVPRWLGEIHESKHRHGDLPWTLNHPGKRSGAKTVTMKFPRCEE